MALDTAELMDHLGWEKAHIVGISMGGMISLELASTYPKRIASLALCVTHAGGGFGRFAPFSGMTSMLKSFTIKDPRARAKVLMPILYSKSYLERVDEVTGRTHMEIRTDDYVKHVENIPQLPTVAAVAGHLRVVMTHHVTDKRLNIIKENKIPITIMCGTDDHLVRTSNSFVLRDILTPAEFIQFDSGHVINVEHEAEFNAALARNIQRGATTVPSETPTPEPLSTPADASSNTTEMPIF
eukprot:gene2628-3022_t